MVRIIIGHIIGICLPLFILRDIPITETAPLKRALTYGLLVAGIAFLEYQLYASIQKGTIYFRGSLDEDFDTARFQSCQTGYALLSGFCAVILLQNLFS